MSEESKAKSAKQDAPAEGINKGLAAGVIAAVAAAGVAIAYFFNAISDQLVGILVAGAFVLVLALLVLKVGVDLVNPVLRYATFAFVVGLGFVALYPAKVALHLGRPDAAATLQEGSNTLKLARGGTYRVLISGHLGEGRDARITYRLKSDDEAVEGALERQMTTRRARRGASIQVPEDHDVEAQEISVPGANPVLVLDQVSSGQQLLVQAYSELPSAVLWVVMTLVLLLGMFLEVKAPSNGTLVMAGASAVCFYFIIRTANPSSMAWATLWGALLAAGGGALFGTILGAVGKRIFKAEPVGPKGRDRAKAKKEEAKEP